MPAAPPLAHRSSTPPARRRSRSRSTATVFAAEVKPHLVHETVRAELNAQRAGTRGAKSRGLVAGGRAKPWRQKGTGRARAGTTRAPHWTGGGVAFPPTMRSFEVKVNRKARRAALRGALSAHAQAGTLGLVDGAGVRGAAARRPRSRSSRPGPRSARSWSSSPTRTRTSRASFRNLQKVAVVAPSELEVAAVVWARSLLVSQAALAGVLARAGAGNGSRGCGRGGVGMSLTARRSSSRRSSPRRATA